MSSTAAEARSKSEVPWATKWANAFAALQAGASGFLLKNAPPEELLAAIRVVAAGESVVAPRVTRRLLERFAGQLAPAPKQHDDRLAALTEREREVLELVAQNVFAKIVGGRRVGVIRPVDVSRVDRWIVRGATRRI